METLFKYQVKQLTNASKSDLDLLTRLTTEAFLDDPVFCFIFRNSRELHRFITVCVRYYLRVGKCCIAYDETDKPCGLALWNAPDGKLITVSNVIKCGMLGAYVKLLLGISPRSVYRMLKMSDLTQKYHIKQKHWYLFLLASFQRGAGSSLLDTMTEKYGNQIFYLENSKPEKNANFYHKHGFVDGPCISWREGRVAPMLKKPN